MRWTRGTRAKADSMRFVPRFALLPTRAKSAESPTGWVTVWLEWYDEQQVHGRDFGAGWLRMDNWARDREAA